MPRLDFGFWIEADIITDLVTPGLDPGSRFMCDARKGKRDPGSSPG